jgi:hypothetical protein
MQESRARRVKPDMRKIIILAIVVFTCTIALQAQSQDKAARRLANKMAAAFSNGLRPLDREHLLQGRLKLSIQHWITDGDDPEYESRTFKNFSAMERWLKREENQPGFPVRMSGERLSCRSGICSLDLIDGQMMHNHVYLTRVWYGHSKGRLYVKRIKILYG